MSRSKNQGTRYLGLDLAWAPRNSSGGAVMELREDNSLELVSTASLRAHEDILSWIARNRGRNGAILAVNAPIIVENTSGQRPCDAQLHQHFGSHYVDEYQVNTVNASHPRTIGRALERMGFDRDFNSDGDRVIETYNQPTQILLFGLERPIRLKAGPVGARKDAVARFRETMDELLADAVPTLLHNEVWEKLLNADLPSSNGSRVGELEEQLEATLCAYTAGFLDLRGPGDCAFLGDLRNGYVLLPISRKPGEESAQQ